MYDYLGGNGDRHDRNWMWARNDKTGEYKFVIIDNGGGNFLRDREFARGEWERFLADLYRGDLDQLEADMKSLKRRANALNIDAMLAEFPDLPSKFKNRIRSRYKQKMMDFDAIERDFIQRIERRQ
jgi:hypothetical protein